MDAPKVIAMPVYNQPGYLRQSLESLSRCMGIENYLLIFSAEPKNQEVIDIVKSVSFAEKLVYINDHILGCDRNVRETLRRAFDHAKDFVIYMEDDDLVACDILAYFEAQEPIYRDDPRVFTLCGWNRNSKPVPASDFHKTVMRRWFTPRVVGFWRKKWEEFEAVMADNPIGWDCYLNTSVRKDRFEVAPLFSRCQNIGAEGQTHVINSEWHRNNVLSPHWAGEPQYVEFLRTSTW